MTENTDDDRISDADIWRLFTDRERPDDGCFESRILLTQGEFEVIRNVIDGYNFNDVLLLMWIRKLKFGMPPLRDDNIMAFSSSAFVLRYESRMNSKGSQRNISENVWFFINELVNSGHVERKRIKRMYSYHLSLAGEKKAQKQFDKMIRDTEPHNDAPYQYQPVTLQSDSASDGFLESTIMPESQTISLENKENELLTVHQRLTVSSTDASKDKPTSVKMKSARKRQSSDELKGKIMKALERCITNAASGRYETKAQLEKIFGLSKATLSRGKTKEQFDRVMEASVVKRDKDAKRAD